MFKLFIIVHEFITNSKRYWKLFYYKVDLQLDLISLLVNFWYEFGKMKNRYIFLDARFVILSNVSTDSQYTYFYFWSTYDQIWLLEARWMIFLAIFGQTSTLPNFIFGNIFVAKKLILNGGAIRPTGLLLNHICQT